MSLNDYIEQNKQETKVSGVVTAYILHTFNEDKMIPTLSMASLSIAESYAADDNQFTKIMNILQHSLVDFKDTRACL